ncbi:hypothetical protein F5X68DRAFT_43374 [Plectosphaerella plurivora]|uniref:CENP-V/GFA domain-containing protein n=1 Tax=Plectosphaerella plurivora TaxID=936078 RepID=A0A9P8V4H4_9PEZI|nr:hypothetical protein F5X68DRAFT_43374 [Plectosphaerella plurivora]
MSATAARSLSGGCHCGRNSYIIDIPAEPDHTAQVLFNSDSLHVSPLAMPLAASIRIPLSWYRSSTHPFFADETHAMIRRVYESSSPAQQPAKRHFCGFCGTPLAFWTERPLSEADFIQLTLATLCDNDLGDLEELGLLPKSDDTSREADTAVSATDDPSTKTRIVRGVPWFDGLVEGSRLAKLQKTQGAHWSSDGSTRVEWEIVEWTEEDEDDEHDKTEGSGGVEAASSLGKRKLADRPASDSNLEGIGKA